jgi:branched-chain amino acid transport system substrate-binding protein
MITHLPVTFQGLKHVTVGARRLVLPARIPLDEWERAVPNHRLPTPRPRRRLVLTAALVIIMVAGGLAGCDTLSAKKAASSASCDAAPGVTAQQVQLGALYPDSGTDAPIFSPWRAGVDARLGVANAAGGVNGRQIKYTWADDQSLTQTNLGGAQDLVRRQGIFSLVELSSASAGSAAWLNRQGVPVIGVGDDAVWSRFRNMFAYTYLVANGPAVSTWGDYVKAQGGTKAAVLISALSNVSDILTKQWADSLKAAGVGVDLIETSSLSSPATIGAQIKRNGDDALTGVIDTARFALIAMATNAVAPGQLKVIVSTAGYDKAFLNAFGKSLPGLSTLISYAPFEQHVAAAKKFLTAMTQFSPQIQPSNNEIALEGWIDADMTLTGLAAAGTCPTRASFMTALRNITSYDAGGLLVHPVNFKTNFGQLDLCYTFLKIAPSGTSWDVVSPAPFCGRSLR